MVIVEYLIDPKDREEFLSAIDMLAHERKRDGAYAWQVFQDTADDGRLLETFFLESWIEHLRQHQRVTYADQALELAVRKYVRQPPRVTHLIAASSGVGRSPSS
jgi:quinol monooxygenase YgiN